MIEPSNIPCRGCGRMEIHKMCPAWGTPYYMSGNLFTEEMEEKRDRKEADRLEILVSIIQRYVRVLRNEEQDLTGFGLKRIIQQNLQSIWDLEIKDESESNRKIK